MKYSGLVTISAILLVLSFSEFDLSFLAWFALVPLLPSMHGRNLLKSFFICFFCGTLFWSGLVYWLINVPKYTMLHYAILMPYLGIYFGIFGLLFCLISKRSDPVAAHLAAPFT